MFYAGLLLAGGLPIEAEVPCAVGVNVNSFQNFAPEQQDRIVQQLKENGVRCVRTTLRMDAKDLRLARRLQDEGIGLVQDIWPVFLPGTVARPADKKTGMRAANPLSRADPEASRDFFRKMFAQFDDQGVTLVGVELGNELNWTDFNGDFSIPGEGRALALRDLELDPEGRRVAQGFVAYIEALKALKDARDRSRLNRGAAIITAGMVGSTNAAWQKHLGVDSVTIPATYAFLRQHGLDQIVDGYGVHDYPPQIKAGDAAAEAQRNRLFAQDIFAAGGAKPYWLTEWGFSSRANAPDDDRMRARSVREVRQYFEQVYRAGRLGGIFWYVWNEPDPCAVYRGGMLFPAGSEAIAPLR